MLHMKGSRASLAVLAIIVLMVAALVPGITPGHAVLTVLLLILPLTLTFTRLCAVEDSTHPDTLDRALVLLRAPPALSIKR